MVAMPWFMAATGECQRCRLALPEDLALVGRVRPGQHLDQGGLAGAVLAEQAVHLAGADVEVDAVERAHAGENLDDAAHLQQRGGGCGLPRPGTCGDRSHTFVCWSSKSR